MCWYFYWGIPNRFAALGEGRPDIFWQMNHSAIYYSQITRQSALFGMLSWSWLNIWFEPMRWLVSGHVTGINSATTTCQPRPANHDLCFLGFWTNQKEIFNASISLKMKRLESYWYGDSYFIHIIDKKTIQIVILSTRWHLISFKNFHCYVLLRFYKQCWKCT